jgi:hypothetical protein
MTVAARQGLLGYVTKSLLISPKDCYFAANEMGWTNHAPDVRGRRASNGIFSFPSELPAN